MNAKTVPILIVVAALSAGGCLRLESTYMKKVEEAESLAGDLSLLRQRHQDLTAENGRLKAKIESLSAELAAVTARRDLLSAELAGTKEDKARLTADLEQTAGQRDRLAADNKDLESTLKAKSDSLSRTVVDLRRKIAGLEEENGRLKTEAAALRKGLDEETRKTAGLEQTAARLRADNETMARDMDVLRKAQEDKVQKVSATYESLLEKMRGEIAQGQVTISELKGKLTLNMVEAILFDSGKAEIKGGGLTLLRKVVAILAGVSDKAIRVEGHTDNVSIAGTLAKKYPSNWELSAARALTICRYLQEQGLDPAALSAVAYGEYKPVADNGTPEGRAKNRRIEIVLVPKE